MEGMKLAGGIKMVSGAGKVTGAVTVLVDVESVEIGGAGNAFVRKIENFSLHQHALIRCFIEFYKAA